MDVFDRAQDLETRERTAAIKSARASLGNGKGRETCQACGEDIPQARRDAMPACRLCIACQREWETR